MSTQFSESSQGPDAAARPVSLASEAHKVLRRWPVLLAVWALVLLLAILLGLRSTSSYSAKATLHVNPYSLNLAATPSTSQRVDIDTEKSVASSDAVAETAAKLMDQKDGKDYHYDADKVSGHVEVGTTGTAAVLTFTATADHGQEAADLANAAAQAYSDNRAQAIEDAADKVSGQIDDQVKSLKASGVAANSEQITALEKQKSQAQIAPTSIGELVGPASAPSAPSSTGLGYNVLGGLLGGLILGIIAAWIRDRTASRTGFADRAGQLWGTAPLTADSRSMEESARLLWRRLSSGRHSSQRTVGVVSLQSDAATAEELAEALYVSAPAHLGEPSGNAAAAVTVFSADHVDSRMADDLDECGNLVVVSTAKTPRKKLRKLRGELNETLGRTTTPLFVR